MLPPAHYRTYWRLEDDEPVLKSLASGVLLYYIQYSSSGAEKERDRLVALRDAADWIGFTVGVVPVDDDWMFKVPEKETALFEDFRDDIRRIRRGNFESEIVQIAGIMKDYRQKVPRWFWQRWPKLRKPEQKGPRFL